MKQSDLRIGNLIEYEKTTHVITELHYDRVFHNWKGLDNYFSSYDLINPIPIPKEWLLSFGFEESDHGFFILMLHDKPGARISINLDYKSTEICQSGLGFPVPCYYVHELQNLYFALTGEELTLK